MIAKVKPARLGFFASAKSLVQNVWNRGAGSKPSNVPVSKPAQPKQETRTLPKSTEAKKSAMVPGSSGAPPLGSQTKRTPSGSSNSSVQTNAPGRSTLARPVTSGDNKESATSTCTRFGKSPSLNPPNSSIAVNARSSTVAGYGQSHNRGISLVGFSSLGRKTGLAANNDYASPMGAKSNVGTSAVNLQKQVDGIPRPRTLSTLMAPTASSLAKTNNQARVQVSTRNENSTLNRATSSKQRFAMSPPLSAAALEQITNSPQSPALSPRPAKIFNQPLTPPPARAPMSLTAAATSIVGQSAEEKPTPSVKPSDLSKAKVLPGRRPRISRSKVIARLASQRAAGAGPSTNAGTQRSGGKMRSSVSAEVAGKTRRSYAGTRGGDMVMSAKKRLRQSEQARRRSRAVADSDGQRMEVD